MEEFQLFSVSVCLPPLQVSQRRRRTNGGQYITIEYITLQEGRTV